MPNKLTIIKMKSNHPIKKISSKIVYENPWIKIHEDIINREDESNGIYGYLESRDSVMTIAVNQNVEIFMINIYSYPSKSWNYELPGGGGDNEDSIVAAKRELAEETGIIAKEWTKLGKIRVCNGLMTEYTNYYLAQDISIGAKPESDDEDLIDHGKFYSFQQIQEMIENNQINDCQSITGIYLAKEYLQSKR